MQQTLGNTANTADFLEFIHIMPDEVRRYFPRLVDVMASENQFEAAIALMDDKWFILALLEDLASVLDIIGQEE